MLSHVDVCAQPAVAHTPDDLTHLGAIGLDNKFTAGPCPGHAGEDFPRARITSRNCFAIFGLSNAGYGWNIDLDVSHIVQKVGQSVSGRQCGEFNNLRIGIPGCPNGREINITHLSMCVDNSFGECGSSRSLRIAGLSFEIERDLVTRCLRIGMRDEAVVGNAVLATVGHRNSQR
ncbi:hypothetical protein AB4043_06080, partial [Terriglobus sp. YAF25]|uniref:hypothetical protein n=1 Tax=Terriglobus sp. YAF25 TaxID=3233080 RepID=UPI003F956DC9